MRNNLSKNKMFLHEHAWKRRHVSLKAGGGGGGDTAVVVSKTKKTISTNNTFSTLDTYVCEITYYTPVYIRRSYYVSYLAVRPSAVDLYSYLVSTNPLSA